MPHLAPKPTFNTHLLLMTFMCHVLTKGFLTGQVLGNEAREEFVWWQNKHQVLGIFMLAMTNILENFKADFRKDYYLNE